MKICPQCGTQYSDETLRFCLQDGMPLGDRSQTDAPTIVMGEPATSTQPENHRINVPILAASNLRPHEEETFVRSAGSIERRSNTPLAVAATVLIMLVVFGLVGGGAWLYFRGGGIGTAQNSNNAINSELPGNANSSFKDRGLTGTGGNDTSLTPSPDRTINATTPEPVIDEDQPPSGDPTASNAVSQSVFNWRSMLESRDLNAYMKNYADHVDYFNKSNLSVAAVRADKARAFSRYSSMNVDISNMSVSVGSAGDSAIATFDKEWTFSGGGSSSSGKVRSQLRFRNIDGKWLITSERDLKVYYTR